MSILYTPGNEPENEKSLKMSLAEARKLFRVSITEDGVRLSKYKSEEEHVIIPSYVDNHPVTQVDFFAASQIKSIVLPETMTVIRSRSFQRCKNLEKVVLPKTIEKINDAAFAECEKLEDINIPTHTELNGHNIFTLCPNLADKNGMVIYNNTFYGYYGDKSGVEIPAGISTIGAYAFRAKENLKSVYIPDGVTYIGTSCFSSCAELKEVRVPESIEKIADWAFNGCYKLKTFNLPKGFVNIGSFALDGCYALSDDNGMVILNDCLYKYIPERQSGPLLKKVVVPEGITRIANCAFEYSKFNVEVVLPSTIKTVGKSAFKGNIRLANINIPDGIECIEGDAFYGCASLIDEKKLVIVNNILFDCFSDKKKVCVPDGVTRISEWAFLDKKSIETIILPQSVNRINSHAFNGCDNLQKVYLSENVETIEKEAFSFCPNLTLFVKSGSFSEQYAKENNIPFTAE